MSGGVIIQQVRERHRVAAAGIQHAAGLHVPKDQRYIVVIYDGPQVVGREASWMADAGSSGDVAKILRLVADDADRSGL